MTLNFNEKVLAALGKFVADYNEQHPDLEPITIRDAAEVAIVDDLVRRGYFKSFTDAY